MNIIIWLVVGGILGWLASLVMKTDGQQGIILNVVVGIVGALIAGFLIAPLFGTGTINSNDFSISGLLVSFLGAAVLLAIVNLPLLILTVFPALQARYDRHKRWSKATALVWLYVSVTGVIVYLMCYHWYGPPLR